VKITHVRVSVLISGPGYNNSSCTLEAELDDGDDYAAIADDLRARCKSQIDGQQEVDRLWERVGEARDTIADLERARDRMKAEIDTSRQIIREHDKLSALAREHGIDANLFDDLPF
jgi:hypothetical protein